MKIQNRLKQILEEKNVKPIQLAFWVDISKQRIFNWMENISQPKSNKNRPQLVEEICKALGVTEEDLFYTK